MRRREDGLDWRAVTRCNLALRALAALALLLAVLASGSALRSQTTQSEPDKAAVVGAEPAPKSGSCAETVAYNRGMLAAVPGDLKLELRLARSLETCHQYTEAVVVYRQITQADPEAEYAVREAGEALFHAGRSAEATPVFRQALALNPGDLGARLGLARALAARGGYTEALQRYDEVLENSPDDFDALQGKALALYWSDRLVEARAIFDKLHRLDPFDAEINQELRQTYQAHEQAYWAALRPPAGGKPEEYLAYYEKRLEAYPKDKEAMKAAAYYRAQLNDVEGAIRGYQQLLEAYPGDRGATVELARLLAQKRDYADAIRLDQELLQSAPLDAETMQNLARLYTWSGQPGKASEIYQALSAKQPADSSYRLEQARLDLQFKNYPATREAVAEVLSADPKNRGAHLLLAQLDLTQGHFSSSLRQFDELLAADPHDRDAMYGEAQVEYYQGRARDAERVATRLVQEHPKDFDALVLLASIERARNDRRDAIAFLDRAAQLSPNNADVKGLREKVEWPQSVRTTASYARELGAPGMVPGNALAREDLRIAGFGTTYETSLLPRSDGSLSFSYLPSNSPLGALQGAVAADQFIYQQSTQVASYFTLRGGLGLVRYGPALPVSVPGQPEPITAAGTRPIGFLGASFLGRKARFDLNLTQSAVTYTPLAVRLGVAEHRVEAGLTLTPSPRIEFDVTGFDAKYDTEPYDHVSFANAKTMTGRIVHHLADHDRGAGGLIAFNWAAVRRPRFSFDTGYSALAYGFDGKQRHVYLGYFNPSFYQRHLLTSRFYGKLAGPLGYDFSGGIGIQQVGQGQPLTRALIVTPAFALWAGPQVIFKLGYTHYNFAETLGVLTGNSVELTTEYKF